MTDEKLTAELACRVMGWKAAPDRFLKAGRSWIPRWRFQPLTHLDDAFALLDGSQSQYAIECESKGVFSARVRIGSHVGRAQGGEKARAICLALGRALQLDGFVDQTMRSSRRIPPIKPSKSGKI